ncbi:MAG: penicillin-binding protein activator [Gammaproteobacteria bacterium]|nr:penicillin-binding protein activator [Gammaproteobacteria bacterium]
MKLKITLVAFITLWLMGCTTVERALAPEPSSPPGSVAAPREDAEIFMQQGEFAKAADTFLQTIQTTSNNEKIHAQLRAVAALARSERLPQAKQLFSSFKVSETDYLGQELLRLTQAHIALAERHPAQVQQILMNKLRDGMPSIYIAEYYTLRADASNLLGNRIDAARELVARENYLHGSEAIKSNQQQIWSILTTMSERALQQLRTAPPPDVLSGWMELVSIAKVYQLSPVRLKEQLALWRSKYPHHPIGEDILNGLMQRKPEDVALPDHIALLLPLSGKYARAGEAVRDGFLAAFYTHRPTAKQTVRIYDTGDEVNKFKDIYHSAVSDGAQFIVGPLQKEALQQLLQLDELPVPTLSLNSLGDEEPSLRGNLFQFGLSPEEEARQVAERTWLDGYVNAAVLIPSGPWGERMLQSYKERWTAMGGKILEVQTYDPAKTDYSSPIQALLNIDESHKRSRRLAATIKREVKFIPRRRMDIDYIFLAAYPVQGRQIQPQLNFYNAADVPVYSTSHIYTGTLNQERDRDMDGIIFGDMPWVLSGSTLHRDLRLELEPNISEVGNSLQRVYALGIDAFNVIGALNTLRNYPYERFDGETGSLSLDNNLHIRRQLTWVKFRAGRPTLLEQGNL